MWINNFNEKVGESWEIGVLGVRDYEFKYEFKCEFKYEFKYELYGLIF